MSLAEELIEPGAHMAGGAGGMHREKLLARRGQAKTPGEKGPPFGSPHTFHFSTVAPWPRASALRRSR